MKIKDHAVKWQRFEDLCQKLGDTPKVVCRANVLQDIDTDEIRAVQKKSANPDRSVIFTISTPGIARDGHEIVQDGWHTAAYRKNPIVMWAHGRDTLPIANSLWEDLQSARGGKVLRSEAEFLTVEDNPFADQVLRLYIKRILNAVSVGWRTLKYEWIKDSEGFYTGIRFLESELTEYSAVPVPADAGALQQAFTDSLIRSEFHTRFSDLKREENVFYVGDPEPVEVERKVIVDLASLPETKREADPEKRGAISYKAYRATSADTAWDGSKARKQLRDWATTESGEEQDTIDNQKYAQGFLFVEEGSEDNIASYKGPHHYVEEGELVTVPRGVYSAAQRIQQGAFDVSLGSLNAMKEHLASHYAQWGEKPPWDRALGKMYENIHTSLKDTTLSQEDVIALRKSAETIATQLYGEARLVEPWLSPFRELDSTYAAIADLIDDFSKGFVPDTEERTPTIMGIISNIRTVLKPFEDSTIVLRELFQETETTNSEALIEKIRALKVVPPVQVDEEIDLDDFRYLLTPKEDKRDEDENSSKNPLTLIGQIDNILNVIQASSPVAGN